MYGLITINFKLHGIDLKLLSSFQVYQAYCQITALFTKRRTFHLVYGVNTDNWKDRRYVLWGTEVRCKLAAPFLLVITSSSMGYLRTNPVSPDTGCLAARRPRCVSGMSMQITRLISHATAKTAEISWMGRRRTFLPKVGWEGYRISLATLFIDFQHLNIWQKQMLSERGVSLFELSHVTVHQTPNRRQRRKPDTASHRTSSFECSFFSLFFFSHQV